MIRLKPADDRSSSSDASSGTDRSQGVVQQLGRRLPVDRADFDITPACSCAQWLLPQRADRSSFRANSDRRCRHARRKVGEVRTMNFASARWFSQERPRTRQGAASAGRPDRDRSRRICNQRVLSACPPRPRNVRQHPLPSWSPGGQARARSGGGTDELMESSSAFASLSQIHTGLWRRSAEPDSLDAGVKPTSSMDRGFSTPATRRLRSNSAAS